MSEKNEKKIGFCSAPWTDCISYADGALKACDRNILSFGNWQRDGLKATWDGEAMQHFRQAISEGRYPNQDCASCHNNGTQRTARSSLGGAFTIHYYYLRNVLGGFLPQLGALFDLFSLTKHNARSEIILAKFYRELDRIESEHADLVATHKDFYHAVKKLRVIAEALEDYLGGRRIARRVATFRQSQLQAKCTARCVMCVGKYTGEIVDGPTMDSEYVDEAFACPEDITDFWCNGAEYMFYKDWKKIALKLAENGTKLRVSTNGILLNEENIRFMIDNKILGFLTMSLDGATKETMEAIRVNAKFEKNMERIRYLLKYAHEKQYFFEFTAAFVMMKRNLHELPAFVRLMAELREENRIPLVTILCQPLENFLIDGYRQYVLQEHHALVGEKKLRSIFREVDKARIETGLVVTFYNQKLQEFVREGMPFPKFFPRQMDIDIILGELKNPNSRYKVVDESLLKMLPELLAQTGHRLERLKEKARQIFWEREFANELIAEITKEFPEFKAQIEREISQRIDLLFNQQESISDSISNAGQIVPLRANFLSLCLDKKVLFDLQERSFVLVLRDFGSYCLLQNGRLVLAAQRLREFQPLQIPHFGAIQAYLEKNRISLAEELRITAVVGFYQSMHHLKRILVGNRKSVVLWKLSVLYRAMLKKLGLKLEAQPQE